MESELERSVQQRIIELEHANEVLRDRERILTAGLEAVQHVATELIHSHGLQAIYGRILDTAVALMHADFASIQILCPERGGSGELRLLGYRGFNAEIAKGWEWVSPDSHTCCGEALRTRQRVVVPDVRECDYMAGSKDLETFIESGILAVQTTPLVSRSGGLLGMVSTHWHEPHELSPSEADILDILARLAADLIERSRVEEKLRESEERLRFAQQTASIGTFDWNIETGVNTWTKELEALYGLSPGGFPGTQAAWEALLYPNDRLRAVQRVTESLVTGTPVEEEWRVVWPDGSVHWLAGRWQVFKNELGNPVRVMGVNIDVTGRKHMEEALRRSEERLRLAIKATNDAVWDIDLKTGTVSWNDTYSVLYGRPETADSWQFWIDRIHPDDRARTVDEFLAALGGGASSWSSEYRFRRVDGEWAYVNDRAYIARDTSGNAWRAIGAMQDLTERKRAEATLRESEERFRRVFEEGPLGVALMGKDHRFLKVNSALCQMLGYPEEALVQMSFADITHPDDLRADAELTERLFRRELPFYRLQKRYVKKSGEIIWVNLTKSLILDNNGEPVHGLTMAEDITEVKRAQEEALARQKLESVGTLASGIAHDFNNILGGVEAQAELALAELDAGSSCKDELKAICEVANRGSEIVRQLMIYAGKESEVVDRVNLSKIVEEMLALLKVSVSKHAMINADLDQDLPATLASATQLRRVVMNLITNASDAIGDRDGIIRVVTRGVIIRGEPVAVSESSREGDYVALEVSDTGCGMSPETQARVFDPFFTTKSAGRGLGLAVVLGIVRGLGGAIRLVSELGKGTTFQILLPCAETATGRPTTRYPPAKS
jgi:PAS domain S-box-containing protein